MAETTMQVNINPDKADLVFRKTGQNVYYFSDPTAITLSGTFVLDEGTTYYYMELVRFNTKEQVVEYILKDKDFVVEPISSYTGTWSTDKTEKLNGTGYAAVYSATSASHMAYSNKFILILDQTAPTFTVTYVSGGDAGYYSKNLGIMYYKGSNTSINVSILCQDEGGSGVKSWKYDSAEMPAGSEVTMTFEKDATHTMSGVDNVNNESGTVFVKCVQDNVAPTFSTDLISVDTTSSLEGTKIYEKYDGTNTLTVYVNDPSGQGTTNTITVTGVGGFAQDNAEGSGLKGVSYTPKGGVMDDYDYTAITLNTDNDNVAFDASDNVTNASNTLTVETVLDDLAPTRGDLNPRAEYLGNVQCYTMKITANMNDNEGGSGAKYMHVRMVKDDGTEKKYTVGLGNATNVYGPGFSAVYLSYEDNVGNVSEEEYLEKIDLPIAQLIHNGETTPVLNSEIADIAADLTAGDELKICGEVTADFTVNTGTLSVTKQAVISGKLTVGGDTQFKKDGTGKIASAGTFRTLNQTSKDFLNNVTVEDGAMILIDEVMTAKEIADFKKTYSLSENVTVRAFGDGGIVKPVSESARTEIVFTENNQTEIADVSIEKAVSVNNKSAKQNTEVRGDISTTSYSTPTLTVTNAGELAVTGTLTAPNKIVNIVNKEDAVLNGGNDEHGAKVKAQNIGLENHGHAVVDFEAAISIEVKNSSVNTLKGSLVAENNINIYTPTTDGGIKDATINAGNNLTISKQQMDAVNLSGKSVTIGSSGINFASHITAAENFSMNSGYIVGGSVVNLLNGTNGEMKFTSIYGDDASFNANGNITVEFSTLKDVSIEQTGGTSLFLNWTDVRKNEATAEKVNITTIKDMYLDSVTVSDAVLTADTILVFEKNSFTNVKTVTTGPLTVQDSGVLSLSGDNDLSSMTISAGGKMVLDGTLASTYMSIQGSMAWNLADNETTLVNGSVLADISGASFGAVVDVDFEGESSFVLVNNNESDIWTGLDFTLSGYVYDKTITINDGLETFYAGRMYSAVYDSETSELSLLSRDATEAEMPAPIFEYDGGQAGQHTSNDNYTYYTNAPAVAAEAFNNPGESKGAVSYKWVVSDEWVGYENAWLEYDWDDAEVLTGDGVSLAGVPEAYKFVYLAGYNADGNPCSMNIYQVLGDTIAPAEQYITEVKGDVTVASEYTGVEAGWVNKNTTNKTVTGHDALGKPVITEGSVVVDAQGKVTYYVSVDAKDLPAMTYPAGDKPEDPAAVPAYNVRKAIGDAVYATGTDSEASILANLDAITDPTEKAEAIKFYEDNKGSQWMTDTTAGVYADFNAGKTNPTTPEPVKPVYTSKAKEEITPASEREGWSTEKKLKEYATADAAIVADQATIGGVGHVFGPELKVCYSPDGGGFWTTEAMNSVDQFLSPINGSIVLDAASTFLLAGYIDDIGEWDTSKNISFGNFKKQYYEPGPTYLAHLYYDAKAVNDKLELEYTIENEVNNIVKGIEKSVDLTTPVFESDLGPDGNVYYTVYGGGEGTEQVLKKDILSGAYDDRFLMQQFDESGDTAKPVQISNAKVYLDAAEDAADKVRNGDPAVAGDTGLAGYVDDLNKWYTESAITQLTYAEEEVTSVSIKNKIDEIAGEATDEAERAKAFVDDPDSKTWLDITVTSIAAQYAEAKKIATEGLVQSGIDVTKPNGDLQKYWISSNYDGFSPIDLTDTETWTEYSQENPFAFDKEGTGLADDYYVAVSDKAGNVTAKQLSDVKIDVTDGTITGLAVYDADSGAAAVKNENGWYNISSAVIKGTAKDNAGGSGFANVRYSCGTTSKIITSVTDDVFTTETLENGKAVTYSFVMTDKAGNTMATAETMTVNLDDDAPDATVTVSPTAPDGENGWYKTTPSYTIVATDNLSGIWKIDYKIGDDGDWENLYTAKDVTTAELSVTQTLAVVDTGKDSQMYAILITDVAGNTNLVMNYPIKVDTIAPDMGANSYKAALTNASQWNWETNASEPVTELTESGKWFTNRRDGGSGKFELSGVVNIVSDTGSPVMPSIRITYEYQAWDNLNNEWIGEKTTVTKTYGKDDGFVYDATTGAWSYTADPETLFDTAKNSAGKFTVVVSAKDEAGNVSALSTFTGSYDNTIPSNPKVTLDKTAETSVCESYSKYGRNLDLLAKDGVVGGTASAGITQSGIHSRYWATSEGKLDRSIIFGVNDQSGQRTVSEQTKTADIEITFKDVSGTGTTYWTDATETIQIGVEDVLVMKEDAYNIAFFDQNELGVYSTGKGDADTMSYARYIVDRTAPVAYVSYDEEKGVLVNETYWFKSADVELTLAAVDHWSRPITEEGDVEANHVSGVKGFNYTVGGVEQPFAEGEVVILTGKEITAKGVTKVVVEAEDKAENVSQKKTVEIGVDDAGPSYTGATFIGTTKTLDAAKTNYINAEDAKTWKNEIQLNGVADYADAEGKIAGIGVDYSVDKSYWTFNGEDHAYAETDRIVLGELGDDGSYAIMVNYADKLGNAMDAVTYTIVKDTTAAVVTVDTNIEKSYTNGIKFTKGGTSAPENEHKTVTADLGGAEYVTNQIQLTVNLSDVTSGLDKYELTTLNEKGEEVVIKAASGLGGVSAETVILTNTDFADYVNMGAVSYKLKVWDEAGNVQTKEFSYNYDTEASGEVAVWTTKYGQKVAQVMKNADGKYYVNATTYRFDYTQNDTGSGNGSVYFLNKDDGKWYDVSMEGTAEVSTPGEGADGSSFEYEAYISDKASNLKDVGATVVVDTTPVAITLKEGITATMFKVPTGAPDEAIASTLNTTEMKTGKDLAHGYSSNWFSELDKDFVITISDSNLSSILINGTPMSFTGTSFDYTISKQSLMQGANTCMIIATDKAGNETKSTITLNYDTAAPVFAEKSITVGGADYKGGASVFSATTVYAKDLDSFNVTLNATDTTSTTTSWYSYSADGTGSWSDWQTTAKAITTGEGYYRFASVDAAGNSTIADGYFYVTEDGENPSNPFVTFSNDDGEIVNWSTLDGDNRMTYPNDVYFGTTITVDATFTNELGGSDETHYYISGADFNKTAFNKAYSAAYKEAIAAGKSVVEANKAGLKAGVAASGEWQTVETNGSDKLSATVAFTKTEESEDYYFFSEDTAGNVSRLQEIAVDIFAPIAITAELDDMELNNDEVTWSNGNGIVTVDTEMVIGGSVALSYSVDGGESWKKISSITKSFKLAEGEYENLQIKGVYNGIESISTIKTFQAGVDKVDPIITRTDDYEDGTWSASDVKISAKYVDELSGIAGADTEDVIVSDEGETTVNLKTADNAGNTASKKVSVKVDKSDPIITRTDKYDGSWSNQDVKVSAKFSDAVSGIDGQTSQEEIISAEGVMPVYFDTVDLAGNTAHAEVIVKIDKTDPIITRTDDYEGGTWSASDVKISAKYTDELSGIAGADTEEVIVSDEGETTVNLKTADNAGNTASEDVLVKVDKSKPVETVSGISDVWTNQDVTVAATFVDAYSGVDSDSLQYRKNDGAWTSYVEGSEIVFEQNGSIVFQASDMVGNTLISEVYNITNIDKVLPTVSVTQDPTELTMDSVTVTATFDDKGGSGLAHGEYSFDMENWLLYIEPIVVDENGTLYFRAYDNAGNESEVVTHVVDNIYNPETLRLNNKSIKFAENDHAFTNLEMINSSTLTITGTATCSAENIKILSGDNEIVGLVGHKGDASTLTISKDATLAVGAKQFEEIQKRDEVDVLGKLVADMTADADDLKWAVKNEVASIEFSAIEAQTMTFSNDEAAIEIGAKNGWTGVKGAVNNITTNANTDVKLNADVTFFDKNDKIAVGSGALFDMAGKIDFGAGTDTLTIGAKAAASFGTPSNDVEKIAVSDLTKLTVTAGKSSDRTSATFNGSVSGSENLANVYNLNNYTDTMFYGDLEFGSKIDKLTIGSNATVDVSEALSFGDGNDVMKIGSKSIVSVNKLDFGDGSDSLSISSNATLTVTDLNVDSLKTLTMSTGATLYLADQDQVDAAQDKWSKYASQIKLA